MAKNRIDITIEVDDKGSLRVIAKDADKAASSLNKVSNSSEKAKKSQDSLNSTRSRGNKTTEDQIKGFKGVAGATSNGTKAFSKMNQGLGGSTGLVQTYAILASNIFAATAAFNALRRVGQIEQLAEGLQFVGNIQGRNLSQVADSLKNITGQAISTAQAMRTVAVGISAGFRSDQLEDLARVAKGASIALGRDMGDALDRLVRGTAKIEPEILDELGILVRLDEAAQKYAATLGITKTALTQFDRQQAFLNATIEQGLKKYEDISVAIDPNPYDKLSASLQNLAFSLASGLSGFFRLGEAVGYLTEHMTAMAGVVGVALIPVTKRLAPGMFTMAAAMSEAAHETAMLSRAQLQNVEIMEKMPPRAKAALAPIKAGVGTLKDYAQAQDSLNASLSTTRRHGLDAQAALRKLRQKQEDYGNVLSRGIISKKEYNTLMKESNVEIEKQEVKLKNQVDRTQAYTTVQKELVTVQGKQAEATKRAAQANSLAYASQGKFIKSFREIGVATDIYGKQVREASKDAGSLRKGLDSAKIAAFGLSSGFKAVGTAVLRFLPYIGLIITAGTLLYNFVKDKWFPEDVVQSRLDKARESFDNFRKISDQFINSSATNGERLANSYIIYAGVLGEIESKLRDIEGLEDTATQKQIASAEAAVRQESIKLARLRQQAAEGTLLAPDIGPLQTGQQVPLSANGPVSKVGATANKAEEEAQIAAQERVLENAVGNLEKISLVGKRILKENQLKYQEDALRDAIQSLEQRASVERALRESLIDPGKRDIMGPFELAVEKSVPQMNDLLDKVSSYRSAILEINAHGIDAIVADPEVIIGSFRRVPEDLQKIMVEAAKQGGTALELALNKYLSIEDEVRRMVRAPEIIANAFKSSQEAASAFAIQLSKSVAKVNGPFTDLIKSGESILGLFDGLRTAGSKDLLDIDPVQLEALRKELLSNFSIELGLNVGDTEIQLRNFLNRLITINTAIYDMQTLEKAVKQETKQLVELSKGIVGGIENSIDAKNRELELSIAIKEQELARIRLVAETSNGLDPKDVDKYISLLDQLNGLQAQIVSSAEKELLVRRENIKIREEEVVLEREKADYVAKVAENEAKVNNLLRGRGAVVTAAEQYEIAVKLAKSQVVQVRLTAEIELARLSIQRQLIILKGEELHLIQLSRLEEMKAGAERDKYEDHVERSVRMNAELISSLDAQIGRQKELLDIRIKSAEEAAKSVRLEGAGGVSTTSLSSLFEMDFGQQLVDNVSTAIATLKESLPDTLAGVLNDPINKPTYQAITILGESMADLHRQKVMLEEEGIDASGIIAQIEAVESAQKTLIGSIQGMTSAYTQAFLVSITPMIQQFSAEMRELGPEGEATAAVVEGVAVIAESFATMASITASAADKIASVGSAITAIRSIQSASSDARVAALEKEIEAEKRRDGQSAKSKAKISALEKKAEVEKRKQFERDKKMKSASVVINTAAGIARAWAENNWIVALVLTGVIAAMGALQLSAINSASYDGGASAGASGAASISVGERQNSVNLAQSRSPSGELAYMRGGSGVGDTGANNFVPNSFVGSRASGGNTGFYVGEKGPEFFMPDRPGTIVPADETANVGNTSHINFNIHAIDTQGMQDALEKQKGNMIRMIREAANANGEYFLESVNLYD